MIHDRIRRARVLRGMTLDELARQVGDITKQGLSKFEQGEAVPNSTRLLQLAKALKVKPEYFFRSQTVELAPVEFRRRAKMPQKRQHQVAELMRDHLERYVALEGCFEVEERVVPALLGRGLFPVASAEEAERAAGLLRERLGIGGDAIAHLTELLEEHGIKVVLLEGPEDFDGALAVTLDQQHVLIALNSGRAGERLRFTAAHELGHWVMALPQDLPEKDVESWCHRFAGALLYPGDRVRQDFGVHARHRVFPAELLNAKRRYGISMAAVLRRLKDLDLLTGTGFTHAHIEFGQRGWRTQEPEPLQPERPRRFESLVYRGLAEDLFTSSRAAEFMQRRIDDLDPGLRRLPEPA